MADRLMKAVPRDLRRVVVVLLCWAGTVDAFQNGDFESGLVAWDTDQGWYGASAKILANGEGRLGTTGLKLVGGGQRGMSLQNAAAYPGSYTASAWLKCDGIASGEARVAVEWYTDGGTWLGFSLVGSVSGTTDWSYFSAGVSAPAGTRRGWVELYTTTTNSGTVWFDDITLARAPPVTNLLNNPGFESGLSFWDPDQSWYGTSRVSVVTGEGCAGTKGIRIDGNNSRGIVYQNVTVSSGRYRLKGWIKCSGLEGAAAQLAVDWGDAGWNWVGSSIAGSASGTADWTWVDQVVTTAVGAAWAFVHVRTSSANHGTAWFDDIFFGREVPSSMSPPAIAAQTPSGSEGCLQVTWDPAALSAGAVRMLIYAETNGISSGTLPRLAADATTGNDWVRSLANGRTYSVAARVANADGLISALSSPTLVSVSDRQAPRAGWLDAQWQADGRVRIGWSPHVLDNDVATAHFRANAGGGAQVAQAALGALKDMPRPAYATEPWVGIVTNVPGGTTQIGVQCEDAAANTGAVAWVDIRAVYPETETAPCALWVAPPTTQVQQSATAPAGATNAFDLTLMRGQTRGFQVMVRPDSALAGACVRFDALVHTNGQSRIESGRLTAHFVDYVQLTANSIYTPSSELVWPLSTSPYYPDELADDPVRDLPAGKLQPVFVRVMAPSNAVPGTYTGTGRLECTAGRRSFTITAHVADLDLPARTQLHVGQWSRWDLLCGQFGVSQYSEDGWRALSRLAELLGAYRHTFVKTPWDLIQTWREPDGTFRHDFRDFDRLVDTHLALDPEANWLFALSHVGGRTYGVWECPTIRSGNHLYRCLDSAEQGYMDAVDLLPAIQSHLAARNLLDRAAVYVADEPIAENAASYKTLSARVKAAAPNLPRLDAILVDNLQGYLEIWMPLLDYFEQHLTAFRAAQASGAELWFYVAWVPQGSYPNRLLDSFAIKPRVLHWLNGIYDTSGYVHWALNWWDTPLTLLDSPGDQYIVWPSQRFIVDSSLRFEAEREGLEDWELMVMLRSALVEQGLAQSSARARVETIAHEAVEAPQIYSRSWEKLETVRRELLGTLDQTLRPFLVSIAPAQGGVVVSWPGHSGVTYRVNSSTNLLSPGGGFDEVATRLGTDGLNSWTQTPPARTRFFRLQR